MKRRSRRDPASGIRPYPHRGKFEGQPLIASYVYELTMDGGPDEEISFDGDPWLGLLKVSPHHPPHSLWHSIEAVARENDDKLTKAEEKMLDDLSGIIIEETGQGFINVSFYTKKQKRELEKEWKRLEKKYEHWEGHGGW